MSGSRAFAPAAGSWASRSATFGRVGRAVVLAAVIALGLAVAPAPAPAATGSSVLRVLVTNDDGVKAPGIDVLVKALRKLPDIAVTVVAPAENQSGTGDRSTPDPASLSTSKTTTASGYPAVAVSGFPADAVAWALQSGVRQRPDLVVSGINSVENIGSSVQHSGTVGAARTAARNGIRALAVSQGSGDPPDYPAAARRAAAWVTSHRRAVLARRGDAVADLVGVDNLNVPTCTAGAVRGLVRVPVSAGEPSTPDCTSTSSAPVDDAAGFAAGYATLSTMQSSAVCSRFVASTDRVPTLQDPVLDEVSGVVASRVHPPDLWVENDSGGEPAVYAIAPDGTLLGTYTLAGATNIDWEDLALGPGPQADTSYLYAADIGDNGSARGSIVVYRVPEPTSALDGSDHTLSGVEKISLRYPDHPVDAESLIVDPRSGDLFVVDKEYTSGIGRVFRAQASQLVDGADVTLENVASFTVPDDDPGGGGLLPGTIITGADVSPDGNVVLVRTYGGVLAFARPNGAPLADAFGVDPCAAPAADERQGEAVGFAADGTSYFTISEGAHAPIHHFVAP
jgi:5'/3'-nucleotidase SurE